MRLHRGAIGTTRDSIERFERELAAIDAADDQKKRDAYRKRKDRRARSIERARARREKRRSNQASVGDQVSTAAHLATGTVTAGDIKTLRKAAKEQKKRRVQAIMLLLIPICAITMMFIANAQPAPDFVTMGGMMTRGFSRDTWEQNIEKKKRLEEALLLADAYDNREGKEPAYEGVLTDYKGLSKERFSPELGYAEDYVEINNTILAFAEEKCTLNFDGSTFKGLWAITHITSESGHTVNDDSKILIQVIPSAAMDEVNLKNVQDALNNYTIVNYLKEPSTYDQSVTPWWTIWWRQDHYDGKTIHTQQGPFTMQASNTTEKHLAGRPSEWDHIQEFGEDTLKEIVDAYGAQGLWDEIKEWCWGGTQAVDKNNIEVSEVGDRFCMSDALTDISANVQIGVDLFTKWYKEQGYTFDNDWERITWLRMMHWLPFFYSSKDYTVEQRKCAVAFIKGLNTDETHKIFVDAVDDALAQWKDKGLKGDALAYESCATYINRFNPTFITDVYESAVAYAKEFYPEFDENKLHFGAIRYYMNAAETEKIQYYQPAFEFTTYKFNYMMYEALYNEGGSGND